MWKLLFRSYCRLSHAQPPSQPRACSRAHEWRYAATFQVDAQAVGRGSLWRSSIECLAEQGEVGGVVVARERIAPELGRMEPHILVLDFDCDQIYPKEEEKKKKSGKGYEYCCKLGIVAATNSAFNLAFFKCKCFNA